MMISGTTVTVVHPERGGVDRLGNPVVEFTLREQVGGVLVSPGATADMEAVRPEGVTVALTLHFPRGYVGSLAGCLLELPAPWAGTYRVIGDPKPYMDANTPTPWHMPVEVEAAHG